jgi:hypothetical protein
VKPTRHAGGAARLAGTLLVLLAASAAADEPGLRPFSVRYQVTFMGLPAGDIELQLKRGAAPDSWHYETIPHPSVLARIAVSAASREESDFLVAPDGVVPQRYQLDDGTSSHDDNVSLTFDWQAGRVRGEVKHRQVDLGAPPGTQDILSIRAALLLDFARTGSPRPEYPIVDQDEVKTFIYRSVGPEKLRTALGELDTVVYDSMRKGADSHSRTWRYWFAPSLSFVPVRLEQRQDGKTRIAFAARKLTLP